MPNWCNNTLYIHADNKEDMKELKNLLDETLEISKDNNCAVGLLNAIVSMPEELENTKKGSNGDEYNWYDWRVSNWGTKWDVECFETIMEEDYIEQYSQQVGDNRIETIMEEYYMEFQFDSAWGPPVTWLEIVAKLFPKLKFTLKYDEPGMGFMGVASGRGEIINEEVGY